MTPEALTKAIQTNHTLPWRAAENGTHILTRQGHELSRFASREARDLAVGAVNGAGELLARIDGLELDLEAARKALAQVLAERDAVPAKTPTPTPPPVCQRCGDTGVIETGNNDVGCHCDAGKTAKFSWVGAPGEALTEGEIRDRILGSGTK